MSRKIQIVFKLLLILVFMFSAYSKLNSHTEYVFFIKKLTSFESSLLFSNFLISIELLIVYLLIVNSKSKFTYYLIFLTLSAFSVFLILLISIGYTGNCYCFGTFLSFGPWASLVKNSVLILITLILVKKVKPVTGWRIKSDLIYLFLILFSVHMFTTGFEDLENQSPIEEISFEKVQKMNKSNYLLLDARNELAYSIGHIPSSLNLPAYLYYERPVVFKKELKKLSLYKVDTIIVYCSSKYCNLATTLAEKIIEIYSMKKVFVLSGGYEKWLEGNN